ncbi:hypothetical protein [Actinacidiphila glaucinigra]|uniref:hypothetical protein n=1 Tax=Actinacidiphila glaucinigra TaxID=235986 RepID=UPI0036F00748
MSSGRTTTCQGGGGHRVERRPGRLVARGEGRPGGDGVHAHAARPIEIVCAPNEPDQRLVVYTCYPDSTTARVLPILAGWTTAPHL